VAAVGVRRPLEWGRKKAPQDPATSIIIISSSSTTKPTIDQQENGVFALTLLFMYAPLSRLCTYSSAGLINLFTLRGKLSLYESLLGGLLLQFCREAFMSTGTGPLLVITPYLPCARSRQGQTHGSRLI